MQATITVRKLVSTLPFLFLRGRGGGLHDTIFFLDMRGADNNVVAIASTVTVVFGLSM